MQTYTIIITILFLVQSGIAVLAIRGWKLETLAHIKTLEECKNFLTKIGESLKVFEADLKDAVKPFGNIVTGDDTTQKSV